MTILIPSQEKKMNEIIELMKSELDFVVCGFISAGKSECLKYAGRKLKINFIRLNETLTNDELRLKAASANITKTNSYFWFSNDFLKDNKIVQNMIINPTRKIPIVIEAQNKYDLFNGIKKWMKVTVYYPKLYEIQKWLKDSFNLTVTPNKIQNYNDLKQLLIGLRVGSDAYQPKKPLMLTIEAVMKSTDMKLRLSNIEYLQENYNIKYCLKIILLNLEKYYSSVEKFNVIRILSICDVQGNLYPLMTLPKMYRKKISRKLMYPKELRST